MVVNERIMVVYCHIVIVYGRIVIVYGRIVIVYDRIMAFMVVLQPHSSVAAIDLRLDALQYLAEHPDMYHTLQVSGEGGGACSYRLDVSLMQ